jgi:crotonobetainyl-CoA:carnitine CoA-transferase CaiB-like acyl-CoA transferase
MRKIPDRDDCFDAVHGDRLNLKTLGDKKGEDIEMLDQLEAEFPEYEPRPSDAPKALEGIRVVDFSHFIAGPFATMILADMGADVIKVEAPGRGDDLRRYPPLHPDLKHGAPFLWNNRNKRSVGIDLKSPAGQQIVRELIATADVVVENFSTGVMQRLGIDYDNCRKLRPEIIYCSVSAYGRDGAFADRLGFDPIAQVESGFVSMNGYADREGVRALSPVMDISTAMMACNAILGALVARERSGLGQAIEVSLFDNAVLMTGYATLQHLFSGVDTQRHGNTSPDTCPSGVFQALDGSFYINCGNDKIFQRLMSQVIDRADLASAEAYATGPDRIRRRDELFVILGEAFARQPWSYWQPRMRAAGVPCGQVRTVGEAIRSPEARERKLVTRIPHPKTGWVPNVRLPIRYSRTPVVDPVAAPAVGQHTDEVIREILGYDEDRLAYLSEAGAFGDQAWPRATTEAKS